MRERVRTEKGVTGDWKGKVEGRKVGRGGRGPIQQQKTLSGKRNKRREVRGVTTIQNKTTRNKCRDLTKEQKKEQTINKY